MEKFPDPPKGWLELQARMSRAKTPEEINEILNEMNQVLDAYEARIGSSSRSRTPYDPRKDRQSR
jgi:hypothetical protein